MPLPKFNELSYAHFVTAKTYKNQPFFIDDKCCQILFDNVKFYQNKYEFNLIAWIIMPTHLHMIIWWEVEKKKDLTISKVMQAIKGNAAREIIDYLKLHPTGRRELLLSPIRFEQRLKSTHQRGLKYRLWKPKFYDFYIYSDYKLDEKVNYIHYNPVKAGLVNSADQYKWSSFNQYKL